MSNANERTASARKALRAHFGSKNVSVKHGTGTAYGWIKVRLFAKKPCACVEGTNCEVCRDRYDKLRAEIYETLKGCDLGCWSDDMGYNHAEMNYEILWEGQTYWNESKKAIEPVKVTL